MALERSICSCNRSKIKKRGAKINTPVMTSSVCVCVCLFGQHCIYSPYPRGNNHYFAIVVLPPGALWLGSVDDTTPSLKSSACAQCCPTSPGRHAARQGCSLRQVFPWLGGGGECDVRLYSVFFLS